MPLLVDPYFEVQPDVDVPVIMATGGTWALMYYAVEQDLLPVGKVSTAPGIDGMVEPHWNSKADAASDILLYSTMAGALVFSGLEERHDGGGGLTRPVLVAQSFFISQVAVETVKLAVGRPRPYTALPAGSDPEVDEMLTEVDSEMSFPSGHSSGAASVAFCAARMVMLSDATPAQKAAAVGAATLLSGGVGGLRIAAGAHHPTDVIGGLLIGASVGWIVPSAHVSAGPGGVAVQGSF